MARPTKRQQINKKIGEGVSKMDTGTLNKLKEVAALDGTVEEMCFYAGISEKTYYNWTNKNPDLLQEIKALRQKPILRARRTIIESLDNPEHARWYLTRKKKAEFSEKVELDMNPQEILSEAEKAKIDKLFEANSRMFR